MTRRPGLHAAAAQLAAAATLAAELGGAAWSVEWHASAARLRADQGRPPDRVDLVDLLTAVRRARAALDLVEQAAAIGAHLAGLHWAHVTLVADVPDDRARTRYAPAEARTLDDRAA